jgi:hypothetical protein
VIVPRRTRLAGTTPISYCLFPGGGEDSGLDPEYLGMLEAHAVQVLLA